MTETRSSVVFALSVLGVTACGGSPEYPTTLDMTTWSVAAIDPETGDVGVAAASCVPSFADALAALVPGKGAAATQAGFDIDNRNVVYDALLEGLTAEEIIERRERFDKHVDFTMRAVTAMAGLTF